MDDNKKLICAAAGALGALVAVSATVFAIKQHKKKQNAMLLEELDLCLDGDDIAELANEAEETKKYIAEIEEDIMPVDTLISFAESEGGAQVFGDNAPNVAAHAKEIKAAGAKYCDCPACKAIEEILEKKELMLK